MRKLTVSNINVALLQDPWVMRNQIRGLNTEEYQVCDGEGWGQTPNKAYLVSSVPTWYIITPLKAMHLMFSKRGHGKGVIGGERGVVALVYLFYKPNALITILLVKNLVSYSGTEA